MATQRPATRHSKATHPWQGANQLDIPLSNHPSTAAIPHNRADIRPNPVDIPSKGTLLNRAMVRNFYLPL